MTVRGFPPIADTAAEVLILGSMPGVASLDAHEYYAHPRNAFWPMMGDLVGAAPTLPYRERVGRLLAARIAVWDVIAECCRPGSLDAHIMGESVVANDFLAFFAVHRSICRVFFNGAAAEASFRRHVLPSVRHLDLIYFRLPSTSPAHAARGYADKLATWRQIVAPSAK